MAVITNEPEERRLRGHVDEVVRSSVEATLKVPKLRALPFETTIIERYRRREESGFSTAHVYGAFLSQRVQPRPQR